MRMLLPLAAMLLLSACTNVHLKKPLSSPRAAVPDRRLVGLWTDGGRSPTYYDAICKANGMGNLVIFSRSGGDTDVTSYDFFVTHGARINYINVTAYRHLNDGDINPSYRKMYDFAAYRFSWTGRLIVWQPNPKTFAAAVQQGKLHGKVDNSGKVPDVTLSDAPPRVLNFLESSKFKDVFGSPMSLSRLGPP